jgi:predicted nucleic acid-binding protein
MGLHTSVVRGGTTSSAASEPSRPRPAQISSSDAGPSPTKATYGKTILVNGFAVNPPSSVASADVSRVLLDTTVLIDALRGRPAGEHLPASRRQGDEPWTCAISIEEIWRGLHPSEEVIAQRLVRGSRCAPLGPAEGIRAGQWRRRFAGRGIILHQADCLIAAATAVGWVTTGNRRLRRPRCCGHGMVHRTRILVG